MKIKTKKQMTLPQLIDWALVNEIKHKTFQSNPNFDGVTYKLGFNKVGDLYFEEPLTPTLLFTVEVEEEITEGTVFHHIIEITKGDTHLTWKHTNITEEKDSTSKEFHAYIDGEYRLIWRDGKLIEE